MTIGIRCNPGLRRVLKRCGITEEAYLKINITGFDLYNAGPEVMIIPASFAQVFDWADVPKEIRNQISTPIPTGLSIEIPAGHIGFVISSNDINTTPLILHTQLLPPGVTDEIYVSLSNISNRPWTLEEGAKLPAQVVVVEISANRTLLPCPDTHE